MRNDLGIELDERDYAKKPLTTVELKALFDDAGIDPREFLNPKSPAFKALGLRDKKLSASEAIQLMARDQNLLKRPLLISDRIVITGFDRERFRAALK